MSNNKPLIVGISGKKGNGKDTFAGYMSSHALKRGYKVFFRSFAASLKEEAAFAISEYAEIPVPELIAQFNHPEMKKRWRLLLQFWGTELRRHQSDRYWLNCLEQWIDEETSELAFEGHKVIVFVSDVRFLNEAKFIQEDKSGYLIRVERPEVVSTDTHPSETELDDYTRFNLRVLNDGSKAKLAWSAFKALDALEVWAGRPLQITNPENRELGLFP